MGCGVKALLISQEKRDDSGRIKLLVFETTAIIVRKLSNNNGYVVELKGRPSRHYQVTLLSSLHFEPKDEVTVRVRSTSEDGRHYSLKIEEAQDQLGNWHSNLSTITAPA
jgi:hypothetical protein